LTLPLPVGGEVELNAEIVPYNATNKSVSYTTSDENVVVVPSDGLRCTAMAVGEGIATVTVRSEDGNRTDVCTITVVNSGNTDILNEDGFVKEDLNIIVSKSKEVDGKYHYDGSVKQPMVLIYYGARKLIEKTDYTLKYTNNKNAYTLTEGADGFNAKKAPTITVSFKGDYSGKVTKFFTIEPVSIEDSGFSVNEDNSITNITAAIKGKSLIPKVSLYYNGKALKANSDFSYEIFEKSDTSYTKSLGKIVSSAGDYVVRIRGNNNYSGTKVVDLKVKSNYRDISKLSFSKLENKPYTGEAIEQNIVITDKSDKSNPYILKINQDYAVKYYNNTEIGSATVIINGLGDYCGTKKFTFKISGKPIGKTIIEGIPSAKNPVEYTGVPVELSSLVVKSSDGTVLIKDTHYTVDYQNNVKAGKASVIISGKGAYTGRVKKTFTISAFDISKDQEKDASNRKIQIVVPKTVLYVKSGAKPAVLVKYTDAMGRVKVLDTGDIKLAYNNNGKVADKDTTVAGKVPTVTITGKGCFKGSVRVSYSIVEKDLLNVSLTLKDKVYTDKANKFQTVIIVTDTDGKKLKAGKDYEKNVEYTYASATTVREKGENVQRQAGDSVKDTDIIPANTTINVTVRAKEGGYYKGSITKSYRITEKSITSAKLVMHSQQVYTGREITPGTDDFKVTIKESGKVITLNPYNKETGEGDFVIEGYKNNLKAGKATIIIKGVGNYGGEVNAIFSIKQKR